MKKEIDGSIKRTLLRPTSGVLVQGNRAETCCLPRNTVLELVSADQGIVWKLASEDAYFYPDVTLNARKSSKLM